MELSIQDIRVVKAREESGLLTLKKASGARMIAPVRDGEVPGNWSDGTFYVDLVRPSTLKRLREFFADGLNEWWTDIADYDYRSCPQVKVLRPPLSPDNVEKLTKVEGVGTTLAERLLSAVNFSSLQNASRDEALKRLTSIRGVSEKIAEGINDFFLKAYDSPDGRVVTGGGKTKAVGQKSLREIIGEILRDADKAVGWEDVLENVSTETSFSKRSVSAYLSSEPYSLRIGHNEYIHRGLLPVDDLEKLVQVVEDQLLEPGETTSTVKLVEMLAELGDDEWSRFVSEEDAPKYLWGLLNESDGVQTGPHLLVSLGDEESGGLLGPAILNALKQVAPATGMETDAEIDREFGFDYPDDRVVRALRELHKKGKVGRLAGKYYYPTEDLSEAEIVSMLESAPVRLLGCDLEANIDRFRDDELWYMAKAFQRNESVLQARRVLDELEQRGAPQTKRDDWSAVRNPQSSTDQGSVPDHLVDTLLGGKN